jgi:hypothetical protein
LTLPAAKARPSSLRITISTSGYAFLGRTHSPHGRVLLADESRGSKVKDSLSSFQESSSAGERLIAIAVRNIFPNANHFDWLAERMDPEREKPFVAYHAAVALLDAVINLPAENCAGLRDALARTRELALRLKLDPDRLTVVRRADRARSV